MIAELRAISAIRTDRIADAFQAVPRHLFAPDVALEEVYASTTAVVTKRDEHGVATSSVSAPSVQAVMLEQADLRPGMKVLEIGSGGYNAALLAEMVGPDGSVTTVDIDPYVTDRASRLLAAAGYPQVNAVLADAEHGVPEHAPYDRVLVTVGAWDIPPAWIQQLAHDGGIVVPLRMRGLTRSLALVRDGDRLVSRSAELCGFVKMQGAGAHQERLLLLRGEDIALRFDDGWPADPHALDGVLATDRAEAWSEVTIGRMESFDSLQLWLATSVRGFCLLAADPEHDDDLVDPNNRRFNLAAVEDDSFAYLVSRPVATDMFEFGAHAFGPHAPAMADQLIQQIKAWNDEPRHRSGPTFTVWPKNTPDKDLPTGLVIDKQHSRITVAWAGTATGSTHGTKESDHHA
jgi:protein-L-isoaspartate(D-aspartate) O-methyltransferase